MVAFILLIVVKNTRHCAMHPVGRFVMGYKYRRALNVSHGYPERRGSTMHPDTGINVDRGTWRTRDVQ